MKLRTALLAALVAASTLPAVALDLDQDSHLDRTALMLAMKQTCGANITDEQLGMSVYMAAAQAKLAPKEAGMMAAARGVMVVQHLEKNPSQKSAVCAESRKLFN